jgi:predicted permease
MAALSLALGIGANTAIYSFMDAILMRALPVPDPQSLVVANWRSKGFPPVAHSFSGNNFKDPKRGLVSAPFPYPAYELLRDSRIWSSLFAFYRAGRLNLTVHGQADIATGQYVSGEFFSGLGALPTAGRLIDNGDDRIGSVAADLSFSYAQRRFGDAAKAVGQTILINSQPFTVEGVTAREFFGVDPSGATDIYLPLHAAAALDPNAGPDPNKKYSQTNYYWAQIMGRLRPGIGMAQAQAVLAPVFRRFVESTATTDKERADLPILLLREGAGGLDSLRRRYSEPLYVILTLVGLILAIACANIANLLLVRGMGRRTEMSVRSALGAMRSRIVRQLLTESILLAGVGGILGLAVAYGGARMLLALAFPGAQSVPIEAAPSLAVIGFAFGLSMLTGILFGVAPAWISAQARPADALRSGTRTTASETSLLQRTLVVLQAALSLVLLVGAGLFSQSLNKLENTDLKLDARNRYVVHINPQAAGYAGIQLEALYRTIEDRFHAVPGVVKVGISTYVPMEDDRWSNYLVVQNHPEAKGIVGFVKANSDYFDSVGTKVVMGRGIDVRDTSTAPGVTVVNQAFVKEYLSGKNPIGMRIGAPQSPGDFEIVGVVENTVYTDIHLKDDPMYFVPMMQRPASDKSPIEKDMSLYAGTMVLQTAQPINDMEQITRKTFASINPNLTVVQFQKFDEQIAIQFTQQRLIARLTMLFGALALLLATIGLYGVTAYSVERRTPEIGIRMALGAERGGVVAMVMRGALIQTALGLAIGIPVALLCVRFVKAQLYEIPSADAQVMTGAIIALAVATCVAGIIPARRAASIDPARALRTE